MMLLSPTSRQILKVSFARKNSRISFEISLFVIKLQFQKITSILELLGSSRRPDGTLEEVGFPNADNAGIGFHVLLEAMETGMAGNEITNVGRAALIGMAMGIRLARDHSLAGFPLEAAFHQLRM